MSVQSVQSGTQAPPEMAAELGERFEDSPPQEILRWALDRFHPQVALACSFGAEDVVLVDMIARIRPGARVFYLDTELLFPETYAVRDRVVARYPDLVFLRYRPHLAVEDQARAYGDALWAREPDRCCEVRKVEPLRRALGGLSAWITGIRRDQSPTRVNARAVEWDGKFGLVKVNPLARWSWDDVWAYIRAHDVPYNALHDQNYPSIGCIHCTRPVRPGEDMRAGRWAGFQKTECGLHR